MKNNTLKTILIILIIILLGLVSFGGIYVTNLNSMSNVVRDYNYGMDFSKKLLIGLKVAEDEKEELDSTENTEQVATETPEEVETISRADVNSAKQKIKNRLKAIGVEEFYVRANYTDGSMLLELPNDINTDFLSDVIAVGDFQIKDSDENVLAGSDVIKDVNYKLDRTSYSVPCVVIDMHFKNDFVQNLVANQNNYLPTTNEEGNVAEKTISLQIDGSEIYSDDATTLIDQIKLSNSLSLYLGQANATEEELQDYYNSAASLATIIKDGKMPLEYTIELTDVATSNLSINSVIIVGIAILGIATIWAIYKYKTKGVMAIISLIGYVALMLLLIRYTNIIIAFEGIFAISLIFGIEYVFNLKFIANSINTKEKMSKTYSKTLMQFVNVFVVSFIIAIVFSMQTWIPIKSFGTIMFWGMVVMVAYNYLVTKNLIESVKNK